MFKDNAAFSSFSVNDIEKAKQFYGTTLGFEVEQTPQGLQIHIATGGRVFIYPKPDHSPASFTVFNILVTDIDKAVDGLTQAGVQLEHYDGPMSTDEKGVVRSQSPDQDPKAIAWFKDPASNVIAVIQEK